MTLEQQITKKQSDVAYHNNQISVQQGRINGFKEVLKKNCNKLLASKRKNCDADKVNAANMIKDAQNQIAFHITTITQLNADIDQLIKQREAESEAIKVLAAQGTTPGAVQTTAQAQAEAAQMAAQAQAQVQVREAEASANEKEKQAQTMQIVAVVVALLVLTFIVIAIRRRMAKN